MRGSAELDDDFAFVAECNIGGEFMAPEKIARLQRIADITWQRTLDDRLGLSWEESARHPQRREELPATEHLLADKPSHIIEHDTVPLGRTTPGASSSSRRRTRPIRARSTICRSAAAR